MNTLLENEPRSLDSLDLGNAADYAGRLDALEEKVNSFTARLEIDVIARIRSLENTLADLTVSGRQDLARESTERHEQFTSLAVKISRKLDAIEQTTVSLEEKHGATSAQLESRIAEARDQIAEEASELRTVLRAKLDELTRDSA